MLGDSNASGKTATAQSQEPAEAMSASDFAEKLNGLEAQFSALREQLRVLQKFAAVGTMTAIVAHEMNNLLTPLLSYSQYAITKDDPEIWRKALERNVRRGEQLKRLCGNILSNSGRTESQIEAIQLRPLVEELLEACGRDWTKDKIETSVDIEPGIAVRGDVGHLQQVLLNLFINARHALQPRGGKLSIAAHADGKRVTMVVSDNGPGIAPDDLPRIFEPFFSTKAERESSSSAGNAGLGLHISRSLIEEMDGTLTAESVPGAGATFRVSLPAADADAPSV